mmetsp:Transcript_26295/g.62524  ORF Transcript_26295/g.62524 Transcript_26295/m.62524 type:complete len:109 (+) Transcript_26295:959-1285(+)
MTYLHRSSQRTTSTAPTIQRRRSWRSFFFVLTMFCQLWLLIATLSRCRGVASMAVQPKTTGQQQQLNIAFVTGNKMKVREIEMILAEMGAIDVEDPDKSLGWFLFVGL